MKTAIRKDYEKRRNIHRNKKHTRLEDVDKHDKAGNLIGKKQKTIKIPLKVLSPGDGLPMSRKIRKPKSEIKKGESKFY